MTSTFIFALLVLFLLAGCQPKIDERCQPASQSQINSLRYAIQLVETDNNIDHVMMIKSDDFERVYMVAGNITGDGIGPGEAIGVWAISGDPEKPGIYLSVNAMAYNFSLLPKGSNTDFQVRMSDDGAEEVKACVEALLD